MLILIVFKKTFDLLKSESNIENKNELKETNFLVLYFLIDILQALASFYMLGIEDIEAIHLQITGPIACTTYGASRKAQNSMYIPNSILTQKSYVDTSRIIITDGNNFVK